MNDFAAIGQRLVVGFLAICCALAVWNILQALLARSGDGAIFALAQAIFLTFAGSAAWPIFKWKKIGWYLGFFVVLQWFSGLLNSSAKITLITFILTFPICAMGIWLWLPAVKERFGIKKVFV